jgi:hypothetical protein
MANDKNQKRRNKNDLPACFGVLDSVFPVGENGIRNSPEACLECLHKTDCLRLAMKKSEGLRFQEECIDRAYESRMIGFLERWSKKKDVQRRLKGKRSKRKE